MSTGAKYMNWTTKTKLFRMLSTIPAGDSIYRLFQKHVTKSIIATPERVRQKIDVADNYLRWLLASGYPADTIRSMRHLDFGAGWHPTIPLYFAVQGFRDQVLMDLHPVLTKETFLEADSLVRRCHDEGHPVPLPVLPLPEVDPSSMKLEQLLHAYQMEYRAPYQDWAGRAGTVADLVTSSQVLYHIDPPILDECLKLIFRLLRPGGIFMAELHLFDVFANSDPSISRFNHLQYSKKYWNEKVNTRLMSFNRLKSRDYRESLERAGFEIADFQVTRGTEQELEEIQKLDIHPEFRDRYSLEELSETFLFFAARRK
jgi:SAM-dependent methyltransferase